MSNRKIENGSLEWTFTAYRDGINPAKGIIMNLEGDTVSIPEEQIFFLDGYLITIFNEFVPDIEKKDIIMAAFGLLNGYCDIHDPRNRHEKYCQIVGIHKGNKDIRLCDHWSDIHKNLNSKENAIIIKMCEFLRTKLNNNNGKLGYIEKAKYMAQKLKKESYPSPYYMRGDIYYRECKLDGNTFYIPKSESERRSDEILKSKNVNEQVIIQTVDNEKYSEPKTFNVDKPDLVDLVKADADKSGVFFPPEPDDEIAKYIRKTQTASYHDEFSHEIYAALCHEGESPYSEWVATWLLKCIKKKFKGCNAKQDLMNASFALLVGYELDINNEDQLRCRLHRYLNQSGFAKLIEKNPDPQKRFYSEITDNQLREQVLDIALKYELSYFAELMGYIKTIRTPEKHIKKLDKFGRYNADYSAYAYKPQKIHITERSIDIKEFVDRTEKRINSFLCLLVISIVFTGISIFYLSNKPLSYQSIINPEDESGRPTISFDSTPLDGGGGRQNDLTYGKVSNHLLDIVNKYMLDLLTSREDS